MLHCSTNWSVIAPTVATFLGFEVNGCNVPSRKNKTACDSIRRRLPLHRNRTPVPLLRNHHVTFFSVAVVPLMTPLTHISHNLNLSRIKWSLSICLSVCLCVYVCIYLSIYINIYLSGWPSVCLSVYLSIYHKVFLLCVGSVNTINVLLAHPITF